MFTNTQRHMLRHPTSIALTAIAKWVTADGCVHITESVGSRRELVAKSCTLRRRRRDATRQFRRVGGVYWAYDRPAVVLSFSADCTELFLRLMSCCNTRLTGSNLTA